MSNNPQAGTWSLTLQHSAKPATETLILPSQRRADTKEVEAAFVPDNRTLVPAANFAPGGKYRSIVKLQMRYENQGSDDERWAMGTGWLVRPDVLVTAGHCAYDWSQDGGLGRALTVKAYLGYNGTDSINSSSVQFRRGKQIVTTAGWLTSSDNRTNDVSFIKLESPFSDPPSTPLVPVAFTATPDAAREVLGVVGYPGDMKLGTEEGAQMYEEYGVVNFNIATSDQHMLNYRVSTYAGQSGSPVLRKKDLVAIGAHVYGGAQQNSASPIMGTFGNPYKDYLAVFSRASPSADSITYVPLVHVESGFDDVQESFWDVLKNVVHVVAPVAANVLQVATPFLGPVGGPLAAVAGTALGAASKLAESSMESSAVAAPGPAGPRTGNSVSLNGVAERALLAEAALQTVLKMHDADVQKFGIFDTMDGFYKKLGPVATKLAPHLTPAIAGPGLRLALNQVQKMNPAPTPATESSFDMRNFWTPPPPFFDSINFTPPTKILADALAKAPPPTTPPGGTEDFFSSILGPIVQTGLKVVPLLSPGFAQFLGGGAESAMEPDLSQTSMTRVFQRAAVGEAALQALIKHHNDNGAESWFNDFLGTVASVGSQVLKVAPDVIKTVTPIALQLLKTPETNMPQPTPGPRPPGPVPVPKPEPVVPVKGPTFESAIETHTSNTGGVAPKKKVVKGKTFGETIQNGNTSGSTPTKPERSGRHVPHASTDVSKMRSRTASEKVDDTTTGDAADENPSQSLPTPSTILDDLDMPDMSAPPNVPQGKQQQDGLRFQ